MSSSAVRSWTISSSTPNSMASIDRGLVVERRVDGEARAQAHGVHQLPHQVLDLDADRLGEAADGDRRLDLGVGLPGLGRRRRGVLAACRPRRLRRPPSSSSPVMAETGTGELTRFAVVGARVPLGAAAGAVGGAAADALALLALFFLVDDRRRRRGRGEAGARGEAAALERGRAAGEAAGTRRAARPHRGAAARGGRRRHAQVARLAHREHLLAGELHLGPLRPGPRGPPARLGPPGLRCGRRSARRPAAAASPSGGRGAGRHPRGRGRRSACRARACSGCASRRAARPVGEM